MVNRITLVGNLGKDPELRFTPNGRAVADLSLATNRSFTDSSGSRRQETTWHRVTVWGKMAEHCEKYLKKGRQVYVEGRIENRQWEQILPSGETVTHRRDNVVAQQVTFLGGPRQDQETRIFSEDNETPAPAQQEVGLADGNF